MSKIRRYAAYLSLCFMSAYIGNKLFPYAFLEVLSCTLHFIIFRMPYHSLSRAAHVIAQRLAGTLPFSAASRLEIVNLIETGNCTIGFLFCRVYF